MTEPSEEKSALECILCSTLYPIWALIFGQTINFLQEAHNLSTSLGAMTVQAYFVLEVTMYFIGVLYFLVLNTRLIWTRLIKGR
jgi:hypothetical protein